MYYSAAIQRNTMAIGGHRINIIFFWGRFISRVGARYVAAEGEVYATF